MSGDVIFVGERRPVINNSKGGRPASTLKEVAAVVLKKLYEPDVDHETAFRHAEELEAWAKSRGLFKPYERTR